MLNIKIKDEGRITVKIHFWVSCGINFWRIIYAIPFCNYFLFKAHSCLIYLRKWRLKFHAALPQSMTQCTSLIFKPRHPIVLLLVNTWNLKFFHMRVKSCCSHHFNTTNKVMPGKYISLYWLVPWFCLPPPLNNHLH